MPSIALISMPFSSVRSPSLQLGLLAPYCKKAGWTAETFHLNLDFAAEIGVKQFEQVCHRSDLLLGEWIFAREAYGDRNPDPDAGYPKSFPGDFGELAESLDSPEAAAEWLICVRDEVAAPFLDGVIDANGLLDYDVVAFTCTFQQNTATVALARRLKTRNPRLRTLVGGANLDSPMGEELMMTTDVLDYAVIGEAEGTLQQLLECLSRSVEPQGIPGVVTRTPEGLSFLPRRAPLLTDLDSLPVPDFDEYYARQESLGLMPNRPRAEVPLPFEGSRGCWWGAASHCTFCGLNSNHIAYRSKSPETIVDELTALSARYGSINFDAVDNIMERGLHKTLGDLLVASGLDLTLILRGEGKPSTERSPPSRPGWRQKRAAGH